MNRLFYIGAFIAIIFIFTAIFAPQIATHDPIQSIEITDPATNISKTLRYAPPSKENWFGTDDLGRDVFSRLVYGARVSLLVGISVVTISAIIGIFIGAIAGFYGGWLDQILSGYIFNVFLAFPGLASGNRHRRIFERHTADTRRPSETFDYRALHHGLGRLCACHARTGFKGARIRFRPSRPRTRREQYAPAFCSYYAERDSAA